MNEVIHFNRTCINLAGIPVALNLHHEDAARYFSAFHCEDSAEETVSVPKAEWQAWLQDGGSDDGYGEYTCSTGAVSDALLYHDRCIIHAVAFRYQDCAWLISGPPGAGKTTQLRNLQVILPGAFTVICGDRPALELTEKGVFVHPSPWNGKEDFKGAEGAFLSGLIILERGEDNAFFSLSQKEAVFPVLFSLIYTAETEENIHCLAKFADAFLKRIPVYKLASATIPQSTELLFKELFQERKI